VPAIPAILYHTLWAWNGRCHKRRAAFVRRRPCLAGHECPALRL